MLISICTFLSIDFMLTLKNFLKLFIDTTKNLDNDYKLQFLLE